MKSQILKILRNADGYISGQAICQTLGVSRTAVWKYINQLKEEGYEFDAVSNKGYRIVKYPDIITAAEISSQLGQNDIIQKVIYFDETDSTNNQAKQYAEKGEASGTLFVAETQTGGRGRRGRNWISQPESGIWMTLLLRPQIRPADASMLTLVSAMAVARAVTESCGDVACRIKWPNDIVLNKKKVCGILTEMSAETDWVNFVVIGIGINVNIENFADEIKDIATSLYMETGRRVKRSTIVAQFSKYFTAYYNQFLKTCDLSSLVSEYNKMLINAGQQVQISDRADTFAGKALGVDETGALKVLKEDGSVAAIVAGEVSVRGLYGYV